MTPDSSVLVSVCDKRHNLATTLSALRSEGPQYLERFNASPKQQLWFFRKFLKRTRGRVPERVTLELQELVHEFRKAIQ